MDTPAILTCAQMARADALTIATGLPGTRLMEAAGFAVAQAVFRQLADRPAAKRKGPVVVLCGPGNNGGDGFVAARHLARRGIAVRVGLLGNPQSLSGDAAWAATLWRGPVAGPSPAVLDRAVLAVDALYGAGLNRPLSGAAAALVEPLVGSGLPVVAVDMPSGVHGDTGLAHGPAVQAVETVTFFRLKPAHLLAPGRDLCGQVTLVDIGTPPGVLEAIRPGFAENRPGLWRWPVPGPATHKYSRGHLLVAAGAMTGAARLAIRAARRAGAGLVTVAAPDAASALLLAVDAPGVIVRAAEPADLLNDRIAAVLAGPGLGGNRAVVRGSVRALAEGARRLVLDADGLSAFEGRAGDLAAALPPETVLTPHDGELERLLPGLPADPDRLGATLTAAELLGAVVVRKGRDPIVACPNGRAAIGPRSPSWLATGGSGDVLAGLIAGLLAQGLPAFEAAAAGVWAQVRAADAVGPALLPEDLPDAVPGVVADLVVPSAARAGPRFPA